MNAWFESRLANVERGEPHAADDGFVWTLQPAVQEPLLPIEDPAATSPDDGAGAAPAGGDGEDLGGLAPVGGDDSGVDSSDPPIDPPLDDASTGATPDDGREELPGVYPVDPSLDPSVDPWAPQDDGSAGGGLIVGGDDASAPDPGAAPLDDPAAYDASAYALVIDADAILQNIGRSVFIGGF
jgi:hypothetical protein